MANSRVAGSHKVRSTVKRSELMRSSAANQYERSAALPRTVAVPTTVSAVGLVKTTFSWKWVRTRSTARAFHASAQSAANFSRSSRVIGHLVHRHQTFSSCDGRSAGAARDRLRGPASAQPRDQRRSFIACAGFVRCISSAARSIGYPCVSLVARWTSPLMQVAPVGTVDMPAACALDSVGQLHMIGTRHAAMTQADLVIWIDVADLEPMGRYRSSTHAVELAAGAAAQPTPLD